MMSISPQTVRRIAAVAFLLVLSSTVVMARNEVVYKNAPKPGVAARVGAMYITEKELIENDVAGWHEIQRAIHSFKLRQLDRLVSERYLTAAAKKKGLSLNDYLSQEVLAEFAPPLETEVIGFLASQGVEGESVTVEMKKEASGYMTLMMRQQLLQQHLTILMAGAPVEVYFREPELRFNVGSKTAASKGPASAPVTIVVFSDFECPFCADWEKTVASASAKFPGKVRTLFRHHPLDIHKNARGAAEAAVCVSEQGSGKFWKFHGILFDEKPGLGVEALEAAAVEAGADRGKYRACLNSSRPASVVDADLAAIRKAGFNSTPVTFVNGRPIRGLISEEKLAEIIEGELKLSVAAKPAAGKKKP